MNFLFIVSIKKKALIYFSVSTIPLGSARLVRIILGVKKAYKVILMNE